MKTLLIFRHGKTEKQAAGGDEARALTARGERDSAAMARYLGTEAPRPAAVIASSARRAQQTATIAARELGLGDAIGTNPAIYGAGLDALLAVVRNLPDSADCLLIVGHNPGFEELADNLTTGGTGGRHLPTAGVAYLEFDVARWQDVRSGTGRLCGFYDPEICRPGGRHIFRTESRADR